MLNLPQDHLPHNEARSEWWYLWGKIADNIFFTVALFKTKCGDEVFNVIHGSIFKGGKLSYFDETDDEIEGMKRKMRYKDNVFTFDSPEISLSAKINSIPVEHKVDNRRYYSIPDLLVKCEIEGEKFNGHGWLDHEWAETIWMHLFKRCGNELKVANWEWYGIKFNDGKNMMLYRINNETYCSLNMNEKTIPHKLHYLYDEKIFRPKVGMKYSEMPFYVTPINSQANIGYGMREKTYGGIKVDESKVINSGLIRS